MITAINVSSRVLRRRKNLERMDSVLSVGMQQTHDGSTEDIDNTDVELHSKFNAEASRTVLSSIYVHHELPASSSSWHLA